MTKIFYLLRSFFPSWKFFDDVGPEIRLEVRCGTSETALGDWTNCLPPIPRSAATLFVNPAAAYLHACHNHLNHFNADIAESDTERPELLAEKTTYKITRNLVQVQIKKLKLAQAPFTYQFRISANYIKDLNREADHILISPVYENS
ncbi:MAG: hypothetical protein AABZ31_06590 [Bdellovibrionota bacterium]